MWITDIRNPKFVVWMSEINFISELTGTHIRSEKFAVWIREINFRWYKQRIFVDSQLCTYSWSNQRIFADSNLLESKIIYH